jgi:hypothetical protein
LANNEAMVFPPVLLANFSRTFEDLVSATHHGVKQHPRSGCFGARASLSHFGFVAGKATGT